MTGNSVATPRHNLSYLALGAVLANFIGTMGASMVLIRPLLRANSERKIRQHTVIFFIFAVSNIGGLLTPLGDPPLFLGFLNGVPFAWTLVFWPQWLLAVGLVLLVVHGNSSSTTTARSPRPTWRPRHRGLRTHPHKGLG